MKSPLQPFTESEEGQVGTKLAYTQDKILLSKVIMEWEIRKAHLTAPL